jgi:hypothetical protein
MDVGWAKRRLGHERRQRASSHPERRGSAGKVLVEKDVVRDGKPYKWHYWVSETEAKQLESKGEAKRVETPRAPRVQDPRADTDRDGVADAARAGVPGKSVPPPPPLPRLPNLTPDERAAEERFISKVEADPDGAAQKYLEHVKSGKGEGLNVFSTDEAKMLSEDYARSPQDAAKYNLAMHQAANAVAKRAFLMRLDELAKLPDDDPQKHVLVTAGGTAAGKGYALGQLDATKELAKNTGAVWDAAGEQNATENPWILDECERRGIDVTYAYVHADPYKTWDRAMGRAAKKGRMSDARLFADSYGHGARNHAAFYEKTSGHPRAHFVFIENKDGPRLVSTMPKDAYVNAEEVYSHASKALDSADVPDWIKDAARVGHRVWGSPG